MQYKVSLRTITVLAAYGMSMPGAGFAQSATNGNAANASYQVAQQTYGNVITQLQDAGYQIVEVRSTFLGRIRILARNEEYLREVIVSRSTGEVKRDVILQVLANGNDGSTSGSTSTSGTTSGSTSYSGTSGGSAGASVSVGGGGVSVSVSGGGGLSIGK